MRFQDIVVVMLFLIVPAATASPPPHSPNFCFHGVCLEISQLGSNRVKVTTVTTGSKAEVVVEHPGGMATLEFSDHSSNACKAVGDFRLQKRRGAYVGEGCLALVQSSSEWREVTLEFKPTEGHYSGDLPILHIWAIDSSPVSFWTSGYALRIGEGQAVRLPLP